MNTNRPSDNVQPRGVKHGLAVPAIYSRPCRVVEAGEPPQPERGQTIRFGMAGQHGHQRSSGGETHRLPARSSGQQVGVGNRNLAPCLGGLALSGHLHFAAQMPRKVGDPWTVRQGNFSSGQQAVYSRSKARLSRGDFFMISPAQPSVRTPCRNRRDCLCVPTGVNEPQAAGIELQRKRQEPARPTQRRWRADPETATKAAMVCQSLIGSRPKRNAVFARPVEQHRVRRAVSRDRNRPTRFDDAPRHTRHRGIVRCGYAVTGFNEIFRKGEAVFGRCDREAAGQRRRIGVDVGNTTTDHQEHSHITLPTKPEQGIAGKPQSQDGT